MAEGLSTDLLDLLLSQYIDCADVPAAKLVCRRWYRVWRARHTRPPPGGGRVCPHGVHAHVIDALVNPNTCRAQLGHVTELLLSHRGAPLADEWRTELCFLPAVTPRMLEVMITRELAPAIFARACEVGAMDVARIALGKHTLPRGNSGMFPLACMLLQRHGHAKDVLDVLLAASTVQWRTLLVWCVQNSLDRVLMHLLPRAVAAAGHVCVLNDAMVEALTSPVAPRGAGGDGGGEGAPQRIAQAIWRQPQFASQFDAGPYLRRAMDWQWPALMEAAATAAAPTNEHFMYAAVHATPAVLQLLLSWFKSTPGSLLGNAAYIAALSAHRVDNATILQTYVTPMAFARKRADVFFMSALAGQWDLLYALLCAPGARPQGSDDRQEARLVERLYRAVLYNGVAAPAEARRRVLQRLLCMLSQPPPRDLVCKLTKLARECSDMRPAVTRVAMARVL